MNDGANHTTDEARDTQSVQVEKNENIIEKSIDKLKETSTVCITYEFLPIKRWLLSDSDIVVLAFKTEIDNRAKCIGELDYEKKRWKLWKPFVDTP